MIFGIIMQNQNMVEDQNFVTWIQPFHYIHKKTDDIDKDIAKDVETRFDTSNYELDKPLPKGKNKKVIGLMKDELGGKAMIKFLGLRRYK